MKSAPAVLSFRVGGAGRWQFEELVATFQDFQDWQDLCFIFFHLDTAICNVLFKPQRGDCGKGHYSRPAAWHSTNTRAGAAARRAAAAKAMIPSGPSPGQWEDRSRGAASAVKGTTPRSPSPGQREGAAAKGTAPSHQLPGQRGGGRGAEPQCGHGGEGHCPLIGDGISLQQGKRARGAGGCGRRCTEGASANTPAAKQADRPVQKE